jgi:hypothetical protein
MEKPWDLGKPSRQLYTSKQYTFYTKIKGDQLKSEQKYVPKARARVARFTRAILQSASTASHALQATNGLSNSIMGQSYGPRRIFLLAFLSLDFPKYGHIS